MRRSFRFRLYPTTGQAVRLTACLEDCRQLYNAALEERREAWRMRRVSVSYGIQSAQLKDIRKADPEGIGRWAFNCEREPIRRLDRAFAAFFRRVKAGEKPGYPRFKGRDRFDTLTWPEYGKGCKWDSVPHPTATRVYLMGVGHVKVHQHRTVKGRIKTVSVKREGHRWYVILSCDEVSASPLPVAGRAIGLDVGVARFATTNDGEVIPNPRFTEASAIDLADAQQRLSRKRRGSANRRRARAKVAEVHRRIRNRRADFHHKTARALVRECDVIAAEKLNTAGMTRRARPKPDPDNGGAFLPNGGTGKSGLNRSILDAGWGQFMTVLVAKAEDAGRRVIFVDPAYTSIDCHQCGRRCTRPQQNTVICPVHGTMDADVNGAINIASRAGLGSGQAAQAA